MDLISEIRYALQDAEKTTSYCSSHYYLTKEIRAAEVALAQLQDQEDEIDNVVLQYQLISLTTKFPEECDLCSDAVLEILNIEDRVRRKLEVSSDATFSEIDVPPRKILRPIIIKSYPFPIARSYRKISEAEDTKEAIERILEAFDFSYRYCAYILLTSALRANKEKEQVKILQDIWKSMTRPTLAFRRGIGSAIKELGENFDFPHHPSFFSSLFTGLQNSHSDIEQLVDLRNKGAHRMVKTTPEELMENRQTAEKSLEKFLWRIRCLADEVRLIYLRKPLNFVETMEQMEYEIADCMGYEDDFKIRRINVPKESLYRNRKVCLLFEEDEKKGMPAMLLPLYPLLVSLPPSRPKDQIYLYHDYDSKENHFVFVHPFHNDKFVASHEELFSDLERKIRYGILKDE